TLERLVGTGATADAIAREARNAGMRSLFESAVTHVVRGETSIEEVLRVTDPPREDTPPVGPAERAAPAAPAPARPGRKSGPKPGVDREAVGRGKEYRFCALREEGGPPPARFELPRKGPVILLVDDEDQLRGVMRDLLERRGYTIVEAGDGGEALSEIDRHN